MERVGISEQTSTGYCPLYANTYSIRFAEPPKGLLRWQIPRIPKTDRALVNASSFGPMCPQIPRPGFPYQPSADEDEDCLFLNVYAPPGHERKKLPVMVWIHGGGYKNGNGRYDLSEFLTKNGNSIIGVQIQYRVGIFSILEAIEDCIMLTGSIKMGAFGFLSSADIDAKGAVNAGLLDQVFALSWIQKYISLFGGDPEQVTISGQSAGAGSILHHVLADDGATKPRLFRHVR